MDSTDEMILTATEYSERNVSQCHFPTTNSDLIVMEASTGLCDKKLAADQP
jgi:hypothetical protein